MQVSIFKKIKTYAGDRNTSDIIQEIKNGLHMEEVIALRQLLKLGKTKEYDEKKKSLLSFTPSGTFTNRRKREFLNIYNGNIILDVDDLPQVLLQQAKENAIQCAHTYACFISPGAEGLKIIVRTNATPDTHKDTFGALLLYYENLLNVFIDESGKDIPRLCLCSYDPETYHNEQSKIFKIENK